MSGFSFAIAGERPIWGHRRMGRQGDWSGAILADYQQWLDSMIERLDPTVVYHEAAYVAKVPPSLLYAMIGITQIAGHTYDLPVYDVASNSMSKSFTGYGRWPSREEKKAAALRAAAAYGWKVETDDEADALGILIHAERALDPEAAATRKRLPLVLPNHLSGTAATKAQRRRETPKRRTSK